MIHGMKMVKQSTFDLISCFYPQLLTNTVRLKMNTLVDFSIDVHSEYLKPFK